MCHWQEIWQWSSAVAQIWIRYETMGPKRKRHFLFGMLAKRNPASWGRMWEEDIKIFITYMMRCGIRIPWFSSFHSWQNDRVGSVKSANPHSHSVFHHTEINFFPPSTERRLSWGTMEQLLISINRLRADTQLYAFARLFFVHYYSEILLSGFLVNFTTIIKLFI